MPDSARCNKEMHHATDCERFIRATFGECGSTLVYTTTDAQPDVRNDQKRSDNDGRKCMFGCTRTRYAAEDAESENNGM